MYNVIEKMFSSIIGQSGMVFQKQSVDFMKPVIDIGNVSFWFWRASQAILVYRPTSFIIINSIW